MKPVYLSKLSAVAIMLALASCKKDDARVSKSISSKDDLGADSVAAAKATFGTISNCGIATLPAPPGDAKVLQPGVILAVNADGTNGTIPQSITFGQWDQYELRIYRNGNMKVNVIDRGPNGTNWPPNIFSIWESESGSPSAIQNFNVRVSLQVDGNLVIRASDPNGDYPNVETIFWMSNKTLCANQWPPILLLQRDGNVVEEYKCSPNGNKSYGYIGDTATDGGDMSGKWGSF